MLYTTGMPRQAGDGRLPVICQQGWVSLFLSASIFCPTLWRLSPHASHRNVAHHLTSQPPASPPPACDGLSKIRMTAGLDKSLLIHPPLCQAPGRASQPNSSPVISWRRYLPDGFHRLRVVDVEFCRPVLCRKRGPLDDSRGARRPPTRRLHEARWTGCHPPISSALSSSESCRSPPPAKGSQDCKAASEC